MLKIESLTNKMKDARHQQQQQQQQQKQLYHLNCYYH